MSRCGCFDGYNVTCAACAESRRSQWLHCHTDTLADVCYAWCGQSLWVVAVRVAGRNDQKAWGKERLVIGRLLPSDVDSDLARLRAGDLDLLKADLTGADLYGAYLHYTDLYGGD